MLYVICNLMYKCPNHKPTGKLISKAAVIAMNSNEKNLQINWLLEHVSVSTTLNHRMMFWFLITDGTAKNVHAGISNTNNFFLSLIKSVKSESCWNCHECLQKFTVVRNEILLEKEYVSNPKLCIWVSSLLLCNDELFKDGKLWHFGRNFNYALSFLKKKKKCNYTY